MTATSVPMPNGHNVPPAGPGVLTKEGPGNSRPIVAPKVPGQQMPPPSPQAKEVAREPEAPPSDAGETGDESNEIQAALDLLAKHGVSPQGKEDTPDATAQSDDVRDTSDISDPHVKALTELLVASAPKGVDIERALSKALQYDDPGLVDKAYLLEKGGAAGEQLSKIAEKIVLAIRAEGDTQRRLVHAVAGSPEQWQAAVAVLNKSGNKVFRRAISQMMDSGDPHQLQEAARAVMRFAEADGSVPTKAETVKAQAPRQGQRGISKGEFQQGLNKLRGTEDSDPAYQDKVRELYALRSLGKKQNL